MSTRRTTFGDFAAAATSCLESLPAPVLQHPSAPRHGDAAEIAGSVRAVLRPMTGYTADVTAVLSTVPLRQRHSLTPWIRAASRVSEALANAAGYLRPDPCHHRPGQDRPRSRTAVALHAAAVSMTAGRDLLHTHAVSRDDGTRRGRSEWAPVIASVPVSRALLHQVAGWAGGITPHAGQAALTHLSGTPAQRQALNAACEWLWVAQWAVEAAHDQQPVPASDLGLLHAIPACAPMPRHLPAGTEPVAALCDAIADAAERARAVALAAPGQASWSPELTRESMRHTASHCTVTSWNCHLILRALASQDAHSPSLAARFRDAADAADMARTAWLRVAEAWDTFLTDGSGGLSQIAVAAEDLALWTGRLAYADPSWTPAIGPSRPARQLTDLAPSPAGLRRAVAAVHHACHCLDRLAATSCEQVRVAAANGRLIVPARNLPASFGVPYPFAPAPPWAASQLLDACQHAQTASDRAVTAVAGIADAVRAPSRILTAAHAAANNVQRDQEPPAAGPAASLLGWPAPPGPAERILRDLGVTSRSDLQLASTLDQATSQLIVRAATTADPPPGHRTRNLITSAGTADLISHLFATGHGSTVLQARHPGGRARVPAKRRPRILLRTELPVGPLAPSQARQHLRQALTGHGLSALSEHAELLASELVANAAEHAGGTKIGLVLRQHTAPGGQDTITCEVSDHSATLPQQRPARPGDEKGRGLAIIAALSADSGVRAGLNGKTCWFTLTTPAAQATADRDGPQPEAEAGT